MNRVAIVGGTRTPFAKAGGALARYHFLDLGIHVVKEFLNQKIVDEKDIDELIFSSVLLDPRYPNAAREIVLRAGMRKDLSAHFISNNCISGLVAAAFVSDGIKSGRIQSGLAGGSESMSQPSLTLQRKAERFFIKLASARTFGQKISILSSFRPSFLMPQPPSPKEPSTGLTMGQHCEMTAKEFSIARSLQDQIAFDSHQNASKAQEKGFLSEEISPIGGLEKDNLIRPSTSLEKLSSLRNVFDKSEKGTLSAGNSSALTDGASVVCLMSEEKAKSLGIKPLAFIEGIEFAAIDPEKGLLMAPGLAVPKLMEKQNVKVSDIDFFEIHEAFGAQVAANMHVWENAWDSFSELKAIGKIPAEKINVNGGSIAIGHPFAATGGRLLLSSALQLQRSSKDKAIISVCAAGAMAGAVLLSRE